MSLPPAIEQFVKRMIIVVSAIAALLAFTQCKSAGGSYTEIEYDAATLKTPDGHGLKKAEYPFDDNGNYRKDWVKNKDQGRTASSYDMPEPEPVVAAAAPARVTGGVVPMSSPPPMRIANVNPVTSAPYDSSEVVATAASIADTPTYHRVESGETLYSLARKYGTSIDELKRVNGLSSDSIRTGQSLRLP